MRVSKSAVAAAIAGLLLATTRFSDVAQAQGSAYDHTQFTANLLWCYQRQDRIEMSASDAVELYILATGGSEEDGARMRDILSTLPIPGANITTVPREWYIHAIRAAAATRDVEMLTRIYTACQTHNERAMDYLRGEPPINMVRAARYAVDCKPTQEDGAVPDFCTVLLTADQKDCDGRGCGYDLTWPVDLL